MSRSSSPKSGRSNPFQHHRTQLFVELLEERALPSTNTISGFVYYDVNNNGLMDTSEVGLPNSTLELLNSSNQVIGTTTSAADGSYQFATDQTNLSVPGTLTKTVTFPSTQTDFNLNGVLDQFDPSLGQLQSITIQHAGSITSDIQVENTSTVSTSNISGTVSGTLNLTAPGVNNALSLNGYAGSFDAATYDGTLDYAGTSGTDFGSKTANGSNTITLTGSEMTPYIGTGQVAVNETSNATSTASGGGNVAVKVASTGTATITVTYNYLTAGPIEPGSYTVVQTQQPPGYIPGLDSAQGTVIPGSTTNRSIPVTLTAGGTSTDNDFGEVKSTSISGYVYSDANNNGTFDASESGIAGVTMTLTGPGGTTLTATTDSTGAYSFNNLTPGTYTLGETQPANYLNGTDTAGTNGGTVNNVPGNETISSIPLASGDMAQNYDFGELKSASLSGTVYVDAKNDGKFDPGDPPIVGDTITLTGFNDQGPVSLTTTTASDGTYSFQNLRPGTYAIAQTQPSGYIEAATTVGSQGGTAASDAVSDITLAAGVAGISNNFGEIEPAPNTQGNPVPLSLPPPIISKSQLLSDSTPSSINPQLLGQFAFVEGATLTVTGSLPSSAQTFAGVQKLQNGVTNAAFIQSLMNQSPNTGLAQTLALSVTTQAAGAGTTATPASFTNAVDTAYLQILRRNPTSSETASWDNQLAAGTQTVNGMAAQLLTSQEFHQLMINSLQ